mgnify:CR=1 FL=1|jgi:hypothetical protein
MSSNQISIKPNNHRVYQCQTDKKLELLNKIISEHEGVNILVACSKEPQTIIDALENKAIKVIEDKDLIKDKELSCEFLISFDLPIKNIVYMARVVKATQKAVMILDENEQKELYQVEMLLGRALKQEVTEGFQYPKIEKKEEPRGPKPLTKEQIKEVAKKRYDEKTGEPKEKSYEKKAYDKKPYDKKSDSDDKWAKKKKAPNKFLGKDENGKAIFSGKSGDRNHRYDGTARDQYDAPKKVGKTINIKARKPKEEEK